MFEEEEDLSEEVENEEEIILEGKRWADGGFVYGFNAASASVDFLRQRSRRALKKVSSLTKSPTRSSSGKHS